MIFQINDKQIIFQDRSLLGVNKPAGLLVQSTVAGQGQTLEILLGEYLGSKHIEFETLHLINRLDKETSGIVMFALNKKSADFLGKQFRERLVKKEYHALCFNRPEQECFTVQCYLSSLKNKTGRVHVVRAGGQPSETRFTLLSYSPSKNISLLKCEPVTGRTHQIRAHLELTGCPIVGDKKYGDPKKQDELSKDLKSLTSRHHFLHAVSLTFFPESSAAPITIYAPYPIDFQECLKMTGSAIRNHV